MISAEEALKLVKSFKKEDETIFLKNLKINLDKDIREAASIGQTSMKYTLGDLKNLDKVFIQRELQATLSQLGFRMCYESDDLFSTDVTFILAW